MGKFDFEKLDVYQKALDFIDKIFDLFEKLPYRIQTSIGNNLLRAAVSIANNIAEGSGRRGRKEKRHHFEISQGSAFECIPMLTILCNKNKMPKETYESLYNDCYVISKMLSGLITHFSK
ncbi:MAG: four helix bundle protein [Candidatus Omnitrophica bacterium]|nr:four helix bundle protein [Candidatus Omnitrophota bacterium]